MVVVVAVVVVADLLVARDPVEYVVTGQTPTTRVESQKT